MDTENIELLKLQWSEGLTSSIFKILFFTIVLVVALILTFQFANFEEIVKNWSRYRCNPAFMPFAGMAGYDAAENFQFCLNAAFGEKAKQLFAPIFALIANFVQIIKLIVDVSMGLRQMFSNFFLSMNGFLRNVRDRIQALLFQVRLSFLKMQNLMNRVHATMFSVVFMGLSAITAGMNLMDNSLVKFIIEFCFAPETLVELESGKKVAICTLKIGDTLKGGKKVTSIFQFNGSNTPMVKIKDVHVSAEHIVYNEVTDAWILAEEHPDAVPAPSIPTLICLNVEGHKFTVGESNLFVSDYDETEAAHVLMEAQTLAHQSLNSTSTQPSFFPDYSLGISPTAELLLNDQTWLPLNHIQIGTVLYGKNPVLGIVEEKCPETAEVLGIRCSGAQLIHSEGEWKRVGDVVKTEITNSILKQVLTHTVGPLCIRDPVQKKELWIRDYREAPQPEMETVYRNSVLSS